MASRAVTEVIVEFASDVVIKYEKITTLGWGVKGGWDSLVTSFVDLS